MISSYPLIGVTLDQEPGGEGQFSRYPWYGLRCHYSDAIGKAGGVPLALPYTQGVVPILADKLDGLVITGGAFDISPTYYNSQHNHPSIVTKPQRTEFEFALAQAMLERNKPVLGICGGQQLLNVILGGSLIPHIPDAVPDSLAHEQPNPRHEPGHIISITPHTMLHKIIGLATLEVNSAHHQAVEEPGPGLIINAQAPDGIIEGIEAPQYRFCLGVQWHPEFLISKADLQIFQAFIQASQ